MRTTTRVNPLVRIVVTTPVRILDNNPNRLAWTIFNLGSGYVMLGFDREISSTRGIYLGSGGGGVNFLWSEEFELVGWELYALAELDDTPIYVIEVVALGYEKVY
ncbi:MAG: hypothetical protein QXQ02_03145 [Halobacteria archaeon]